MPTATLSPDIERDLCQYAWVINILKDTYGILTNTLVTNCTSISGLIADTYAALVSGTIELFPKEARMCTEVFEQGIRLMETTGLLTDTLAAALTTVNTASANTDLRYLISNALSDTSLDCTLDLHPGVDLGMASAITSGR